MPALPLWRTHLLWFWSGSSTSVDIAFDNTRSRGRLVTPGRSTPVAPPVLCVVSLVLACARPTEMTQRSGFPKSHALHPIHVSGSSWSSLPGTRFVASLPRFVLSLASFHRLFPSPVCHHLVTTLVYLFGSSVHPTLSVSNLGLVLSDFAVPHTSLATEASRSEPLKSESSISAPVYRSCLPPEFIRRSLPRLHRLKDFALCLSFPRIYVPSLIIQPVSRSALSILLASGSLAATAHLPRLKPASLPLPASSGIRPSPAFCLTSVVPLPHSPLILAHSLLVAVSFWPSFRHSGLSRLCSSPSPASRPSQLESHMLSSPFCIVSPPLSGCFITVQNRFHFEVVLLLLRSHLPQARLLPAAHAFVCINSMSPRSSSFRCIATASSALDPGSPPSLDSHLDRYHAVPFLYILSPALRLTALDNSGLVSRLTRLGPHLLAFRSVYAFPVATRSAHSTVKTASLVSLGLPGLCLLCPERLYHTVPYVIRSRLRTGAASQRWTRCCNAVSALCG
ncbi:uncharacterized protein B0H18DRAFT_421870 [Fomitopsis serialis]|uniref:uncharacterized protein n=1 Tax=Fomitopsis serialis TaxID=139415 RepID=UPI002007CDE4|nr:uncharacterized protein B0H18DRAFT_421870 [Neoantrodia serialis]KAH9935733.1 hypothetical protein B0H18DRAFT_421870 [Neoantrodia serialis]